MKAVGLFSILVLVGCASRKVITATAPQNPTSYLFNVNADSARFLFQKAFFKYHGSLLFDLDEIAYHGDGKQNIWREEARNALEGEKNKNGIWMLLQTDSSTVYKSKTGKPLSYRMHCKAHFEQVNEQETRMDIVMYSANVEVGKRLLPQPPHFVNNPILKEVKPTPVEAYKILLCFGKAVGVAAQMPPLKTP